MHYSQILTPEIGVIFDVAYLKNWLQLPSTFTDDDDIIEDLEKAAREYCRDRTNRIVLDNMTAADTWYGLPYNKLLVLKYGPGTLDELQVWDEAANDWLLAWSVNPGETITAVGVEIEYYAGVPMRILVISDGDYKIFKALYNVGTDSAQIPEQYKQAMRMVISNWYNKRDLTTEQLAGIENLLKKIKIGERG